MNKFLLSIVGFAIAIATTILVMIHGWGLEPVSWGWIIGGGVVGSIIAGLFQLAEK